MTTLTLSQNPQLRGLSLVLLLAAAPLAPGGLRACGPDDPRPPPPPPPADAGERDAGEPSDAGAPDVTGQDAGASDAIAADAEVPDASAPDAEAPDAQIPPRVRFLYPQEGAVVRSPVEVQLEAEGIRIEAQNGTLIQGSGAFVLFMDVDCPYAGSRTDVDAYVVHLDDGQTVHSLPLSLGAHTICLGVENGLGFMLEPRELINVTVE